MASNVVGFLKDKNILMTGLTGFLGKSISGVMNVKLIFTSI